MRETETEVLLESM